MSDWTGAMLFLTAALVITALGVALGLLVVKLAAMLLGFIL